MKPPKLALPLLLALGCLVAGATTMSAVAAPTRNHKHAARNSKKLRLESVKVAGKAGPLTLRVRADVRTEVRLKVDGHRVDHSFEQVGRHSQRINLRAGDHLRAGTNRLSLTATRRGVSSRADRSVKVPGWALHADAGEDTGAVVHGRVQVGATPGPAAAAGDVHYDWRIVGRPNDAAATLTSKDDPDPVLHATDPGRYLLQETADPEGTDEPISHDQVTVSVVPDDPPIGVPLNTIDQGGITIAGKTYGAGGPVDGSSYVVLERTTRAVVRSGAVADDADGIATLTGLADQYGSGSSYMRYMLIISGRRGVPDSQLGAFAALLKKLGVALLSPENFQALRDGQQYSVIGIPGAPAGAATVRIPGGYVAPVSGAITGYLTKNQAVDAEGTALYDYNAGEQPSFDTRAPGSTGTTNKMTIDGRTYTATLPAGTTAGFQVVVLESLSLRELSNEALATNGPGDQRKLQGETAAKLLNAIEKPGGPTVFLQTIGKPSAAGPEWKGVVEALTRLGANPQLVNALNGTNEYAFIARNGAKAPPAEASTAYDRGPYPAPGYPPARLVGTLARSRTSNYVPNVFSTPTTANPEGSVNLSLMKVAYQAPQPWPDLAPGAAPEETKAAQTYVCEELNFCQPANSCPSVRECFWRRYSADWDAKLAKIGAISFRDGKGFKESTFTAVKDELSKEVEAVANVKSYLRQLQEPFENSGTRSYVDLRSISDNIYNSLQRPPITNSTSWILGLVGKAVALGGFAPPPASAAAAGLSAAFGLAAYLTDKTGQPLLGAEVKARSDALAGEMLDRIDAARKTMSGLGMMLVSDYGKLTNAYKHVDSDWSLPAPDVAANTLRTASRQWFYEALIPTAFPYLIRADNANNARGLDCRLDRHDGWPNQPDMFQMNATTGYDANGRPINSIFFFARGLGGAMSPAARIGDEMFRPRNGQNPGLGMEKLQFFTARVWGGRIQRAINHTAYCSLGFLPQEW